MAWTLRATIDDPESRHRRRELTTASDPDGERSACFYFRYLLLSPTHTSEKGNKSCNQGSQPPRPDELVRPRKADLPCPLAPTVDSTSRDPAAQRLRLQPLPLPPGGAAATVSDLPVATAIEHKPTARMALSSHVPELDISAYHSLSIADRINAVPGLKTSAGE